MFEASAQTRPAARTFWWHPAPSKVAVPGPEAGTFWWHPAPSKSAPRD